MKEDIKKWFKENHKLITVIGAAAVVTVLAVRGYKGLIRLIDIQEQTTMMVVENNLKLLKDGEVFNMAVGNKTDDFTRTITSKQWTKHNGETLYLGKVSEVIALSEQEQISKQLQKITSTINHAVDTLTKQ